MMQLLNVTQRERLGEEVLEEGVGVGALMYYCKYVALVPSSPDALMAQAGAAYERAVLAEEAEEQRARFAVAAGSCITASATVNTITSATTSTTAPAVSAAASNTTAGADSVSVDGVAFQKALQLSLDSSGVIPLPRGMPLLQVVSGVKEWEGVDQRRPE